MIKSNGAAIWAGVLMFALASAEAQPQILRNHVPSAVAASRRIGAVSDSATLALAIGLPLRNQVELDVLVEQIADPQNASYRQYLTVAEFTSRFGPTQQDYDKLIAYLESTGLTVTNRHPNRMIVDVTGPVATINSAFHVGLTVFDHPARGQFFAPDRDPSLDAGVQILDVAGLDNFVLPRPMDLKMRPLDVATPLVSGSGPSGLFLGKDFRAAYAPGVTMTGAGQTIGLVEFDGFYAGDVTANFKAAGLPAIPVSTVLLDGFNGTPGSGNIEVILDIMMAAYMAPGSSVIVYEGENPNDVLNRMATDNSSRQLSCSWGYGINSTTEQIFKQMIAQGQTFMTASGDSGAYSGAIMPPADDPNVTAVGGTALSTTGPGGSWISESAWSGSGGGVSTTYAIPSYQQNTNVTANGGSKTMRNMPDVALTGAVQMYLIYNNGSQTAVGGTSAATPLWTAFISLANQQAASSGKPSIGFLNPTIYAIGNAPTTYAASMHDITTGNTGFAAGTGYDLTTGWGSPNGQSLINNLSSLPTTPSFTLVAAPNPVTVQAGSTTTTTVQVTAVNSFSAAVTLTLAGLPSGVTGSFGTFSTGRASILTLTAASTTIPGTYSISVNGASGILTATTALSLTVTGAPGYTLTTSTPSVTVVQSATATAPITIAASNGFTSTVALAVTGLPTGVTAAFSPASATTTSTLTFTTSSTAAIGSATVTVTGKSGSLSNTLAISLTVAAPASFSVAATTAALNLTQGATATNTVTVTPKSGFTGKPALTISGLPAGVTASFNPASTSTTSVATLTAAANATVGTSTVIVTGTSGATSSSATFSLTVKAGPSFTVAASPASLSVASGASGTSVITITPANGFTGTPTAAVTGLPSGVTASFIGTTLKLTAAAAAAGTATVTVTETSGAFSAQTTIALTITSPAGFKLSASAININTAPGASGSSVITITPQSGFNATVALSAVGLPTGVTAVFSPAAANVTSILTLTATGAAGVRSSAFTINGVSGSVASSLAMTVTVAPPPDFSITLNPTALKVVKGMKGSAALSLMPLNGFSGSVDLAFGTMPAGVTAAFSVVNSGVLAIFTTTSTAAAATTPINIVATSGALTHTAVLSLTVTAPAAAVVPVDLSASYNVPASAVDYLPFTTGGLDAGGRSYSGALLGASQTAGGTLFAIGPMGMPDAVSGQTVALPSGQYTALKILATGLNGNQTAQKFTVTYTDGTTTAFTQSLSDWFTPQSYPSETQALTMNYRDNSTGTTDGEPFYLYQYSFTLNSAKPVRSITLPANRNVVVLAMTLNR